MPGMNELENETLLVSYLSEECSEEEKEIVETWISSDITNEKLMKEMKKTWNVKAVSLQEWDIKKIWAKVNADINRKPENLFPHKYKKTGSSSSYSWILRVAAVLVLTFVASFSYIKYIKPLLSPESAGVMQETVVGKGMMMKILLSDGSLVKLDAGSSLKYPTAFEKDVREVYLTGEGYFEVVPDKRRRFVVHVNNAVIHVLGTKFNVRAWDETEIVKVAVKEGSVSLGMSQYRDKDKVVISRGEFSVLQKNGKLSTPEKTDIEKHLGWMNYDITFTNATFKEVLGQMSRWYNLKFVLTDESFADDTLSVHIRNRPVEQNLELLTILMDLTYERKGNIVTFSSRL
jgi:ferric-dicitrate binding protein FerR (iron transport regulator)